jgi:hypothetical protein
MKDMRDTIKIYAVDGREFTGTNYEALVKERDAYEADLKLKKEKEEAERIMREKKQAQLQYRAKYLKEIDEATQKVHNLIEDYEKLSGRKFVYTYDYDQKRYVASDTKNSIDFAYDDLMSGLLKAIREV